MEASVNGQSLIAVQRHVEMVFKNANALALTLSLLMVEKIALDL